MYTVKTILNKNNSRRLRVALYQGLELVTPQFHGRILSLIIRRRSSTDISTAISPTEIFISIYLRRRSQRIILVDDLREIDLRLIIRDNIRLWNWGVTAIQCN